MHRGVVGSPRARLDGYVDSCLEGCVAIETEVRLPAVHPFTGMDVGSALAERASRLGDKTFIVWESGPDHEPTTWTYREFATEVDRVARGLVERGVVAGDGVVLLLENTPAFLFCWFACACLGAVAIDTNSRYAPDELAHALAITGAVGAITHTELLRNLEQSGVDLAWIETIDEETGTCPALCHDAMPVPDRAADPGAPLCVQFTSGTTSRPKAVLFTHANALWGGSVGAVHGQFTEDDVTLVYGPLFHTQALSWLFLPTFWVGGTVVLLPKFTASRFWEISVRHRCTLTSLLGIMMTTLGAQPVPEHHYRRWVFGLEVPQIEERYGIRLFNAWGMTEVVTEAIIGDPHSPVDDGAIGRAAPEYAVRIAREDGTDAAVGEAGDLLIGGVRGLSIFAEYLRDREATADAFDERGYFRTGDRVMVLASGAVQFVSRAKDMLKVGGENVAAVEIERVLLGTPGIAAAATVGRPDPILDEVAVAFVTIVPGADEDEVVAAAHDACIAQLADFKVPRRIYVIDELPEAVLGKIAKGALRDEALQRMAAEGETLERTAAASSVLQIASNH
jgi:crotonobetaine/carnitine-CoA ligase